VTDLSVVNALRAECEMKRFAARAPGDKPAVGKGNKPAARKTQVSRISHQEEKLQPKAVQAQIPQPTQGHWQTSESQPPNGQMPQSEGQSTQGQTSLPPRGQIHQSTQGKTPQPPQGQTSQPTRKQTSQSPEQQTPQTTGGQKPPAKEKKRRTPATTATSATTAGSSRR
jgi:hypothetical protein